jgi:alpha-beta hydrolase superfamily lysophospholipase
MILKSDLNARKKITATGTLALSVLRYSFGIINWRTEDINKLTKNQKDSKNV